MSGITEFTIDTILKTMVSILTHILSSPHIISIAQLMKTIITWCITFAILIYFDSLLVVAGGHIGNLADKSSVISSFQKLQSQHFSLLISSRSELQ